MMNAPTPEEMVTRMTRAELEAFALKLHKAARHAVNYLARNELRQKLIDAYCALRALPWNIVRGEDAQLQEACAYVWRLCEQIGISEQELDAAWQAWQEERK